MTLRSALLGAALFLAGCGSTGSGASSSEPVGKAIALSESLVVYAGAATDIRSIETFKADDMRYDVLHFTDGSFVMAEKLDENWYWASTLSARERLIKNHFTYLRDNFGIKLTSDQIRSQVINGRNVVYVSGEGMDTRCTIFVSSLWSKRTPHNGIGDFTFEGGRCVSKTDLDGATVEKDALNLFGRLLIRA